MANLFKQKNTLLIILVLLVQINLSAQVKRYISRKSIDSICALNILYDKPERLPIKFPIVKVSDDYKLNALHKALPDSLNDENKLNWWYYHYYFEQLLIDYDETGDSLTYPLDDPMKYKLDHTYFFDINGDGLLDFIHYNKYFRALALDHDAYEFFLMNKDSSYQMVKFNGFITDIKFNRNHTLKSMTCYQAACCTDVNHIFYYYNFDKASNTLVLNTTKTVLTCQFKKKKEAKH